jgi:ketosteroid isomerase-like protein
MTGVKMQTSNQTNQSINQSINQVLLELNQNWDAAFNSQQPALLASLYDADATVMPAGAPQVSGSKAIEEFWSNTLAQGVVDHKIELIESGVEGNLAFQRGLWSAAAVNAEGARLTFSGNLHLLYRRQQDGSWKALTHIWN